MSLNEKEYADEKLGLVCPNCESYNIETIESVAVGNGCAWQPVMCNQCESTWDDQYTLIGYGDLEIGS
jgi:transposase-like protein